jgi:hemoglobin
MMKSILAAAAVLLFAVPTAFAAEQPVKPYVQSDANAGAAPFKDEHVYKALHGMEGIGRIVTRMMAENESDPRTADFFKASDLERLHRSLVEQFCYVSGGPCHYTGMDMKKAHEHMGVEASHFNALVEQPGRRDEQGGRPLPRPGQAPGQIRPDEAGRGRRQPELGQGEGPACLQKPALAAAVPPRT